jgi:hypothetical protein
LGLINELISQGENQTVEFKKVDVLKNPVELAKTMVAFANTNGGRILIGVCDDGTLEGMKAEKAHETYIMNIARDRCDPPLIPQFSVCKTSHGDIYIIKILRYQIFPHAVKTRDGPVYYIRVGSTDRPANPVETALLFESTKKETKKPKLELLLIDPEGNAAEKIRVQPTFIRIRKEKISSPIYPYIHGMAELQKVISSLPFIKKEPPKDLIPIGIQLSNAGEAPAYGIKVFLEFPENCELIEEHEAIGSLFVPTRSSSIGGLFVNNKNKHDAMARVEVLGNDLQVKDFEKIYVRFPEKEQEYVVKAQVTYHNFPPEDFEFKIYVKPKIIEKVEYVYEQEEDNTGA